MKIRNNLGLILFVVSFNLFATVSDDLTKEVKISASKQEVDIKNGISTLFGPVEVHQGSIVILADMIKIIDRKDSTKLLIATGKPASYSQVMDNGKLATAESLEIQYDMGTNILTLLNNASLKQEGNSVHSSKIKYDIQEQKIIAESGKERVTTVLQPDSYKDSKTKKGSKQ